MNIFVFDEDPQKSARAHSDRHVVKMVLETAQMLCTVHHLSGQSAPYAKTHTEHPCVKWVQESIENYRWLVKLGLALAREYTHRYDRRHKSQDVIEWCADHEPALPEGPRTPFALAMPEKYQGEDAVESYRRYFRGEKMHLANWTRREPPGWLG